MDGDFENEDFQFPKIPFYQESLTQISTRDPIMVQIESTLLP